MLTNLSYPTKEKEPESDYDRSLRKSIQKRKQGKSTVPQLGQQPNQTLEPLMVQSTQEEAMADFVTGSTLTKGQIQGTEEIPVHEGAQRKKFVIGEPLIWPQLVPLLPTKMWRLHEWYMKMSNDETIMFAIQIKDEHYFRGADDIWIEFISLYELYNQDAIDKSLISAWVL